jgi:hypothetical protein
LVLTNGKLPNLRLRQNQSFQEKVMVNETLYVHERFPIQSQESIHSKKKLSMQRFPSKVENISFPKFVSKSSKKMEDLQIIEVEEK